MCLFTNHPDKQQQAHAVFLGTYNSVHKMSHVSARILLVDDHGRPAHSNVSDCI